MKVPKKSSWGRLQRKLFRGPQSPSDLATSAFRRYYQESFSRPTVEVFHPESPFRLAWDWLLISAVLYQTFQVPFHLCFQQVIGPVTNVLEITSVCAFVLDIGVTLNTGYYSQGTLVKQRNRVVAHYLHTWFCLDVVASFPLAWVLSGVRPKALANCETAAEAVGTLLRILRLIRLGKLGPLLTKLENYIANDSVADCFHFARLVSLMLLTGHWLACWTFFLRLSDYYSHSSLCSSPTCYSSLAEQYVSALYFSFATMTTVGYGDIKPESTNERLFSIFSMSVATALMGYIMGSIGSLISKRKAAYSQYRLQVLALNQYMRKQRLPVDLQLRVRMFCRIAWTRLKEDSTDVSSAISQLSDPLKDAISAEVNGALLHNCAVFTSFDPYFLAHIGKKLQAEAFAPDDPVFESGQICGKMYFITRGAVEIYHERTESTFAFLGRGDVFGEIGFFLGWPRCASSRCVDYTDLLSLDRANVETLLAQYPAAKQHFNLLATEAQTSQNLSCLSVCCYLCGGLGHVAIHCKLCVFQRDNLKSKWLQSRHIKYINKELPHVPNHVRKEKRTFPHISARNVIGKRRNPAELSLYDANLLPLITEYEETLERERGRTTTTGQTDCDRPRVHFNFATILDSPNTSSASLQGPQSTPRVFPWLNSNTWDSSLNLPPELIQTNEEEKRADCD